MAIMFSASFTFTKSTLYRMAWEDHIVADKDVLMGKPVIKGTRLSVEFLIGLMAQGWTEQQVLENYPRLTAKDLSALFAYIHYCMKDGLLDYPFKQSA